MSRHTSREPSPARDRKPRSARRDELRHRHVMRNLTPATWGKLRGNEREAPLSGSSSSPRAYVSGRLLAGVHVLDAATLVFEGRAVLALEVLPAALALGSLHSRKS